MWEIGWRGEDTLGGMGTRYMEGKGIPLGKGKCGVCVGVSNRERREGRREGHT